MTDPDFEAYKADLEAAERRVAGEIDPGRRAMVVAILVFVLVLSFVFPHTGAARGVDVLMASDTASAHRIALPSRIFCWFALIFGVGFSMLALTTRRWTLAWIALAGTALAGAFGMLAVWSRQTVESGYTGPGIGLILGWVTVLLLAFHWARVVWTRTAVQMAAEAQRRAELADRQAASLLDGFGEKPDGTPPKPASS
ncbi:MAG: hypothetical protein QG655_901 [Actinomycetota bacterium]|jgi:hypothetical protein|nr:hypothetical protein [Actinomycetota bacterium]